MEVRTKNACASPVPEGTGDRPAIRYVLLDVDDTLLDFGACSAQAVRESCGRFGLPYTRQLQETFRQVTAQLWHRLEKGELTRQDIFDTRWAQVFAILGISADSRGFEASFHELLAQSHIAMPGARELLAYLGEKYSLYAASNAPHAQQEYRLLAAGLLPYLRGIFTSEQIGAAKPDARFFQACLDALGARKEQVVLIGDSLSADIAGGAAFGIRTCWLKRTDERPACGQEPDWTAESLAQIREIL